MDEFPVGDWGPFPSLLGAIYSKCRERHVTFAVIMYQPLTLGVIVERKECTPDKLFGLVLSYYFLFS